MPRLIYWIFSISSLFALTACPGQLSFSASTSGVGGQGGFAGGRAGAGGSPAGSGGASVGGAAGAPTTGDYSIEGSFLFTLADVEVNMAMGPAQSSSPSEGVTMRLDLSAKPTNVEEPWLAVLTPPWGTPTPFVITERDGAIELTGKEVGAGAVIIQDNGNVSDSWQSITLFLNENEHLNGIAKANGQVARFVGNAGYTGSLNAKAKITLDNIPPEGSSTIKSTLGNPTKLLPWDAYQVRFSEPIKSSDVFAHMSTTLEKGNTNESTYWETSPTDPSAKLFGITSLSGYAKIWSPGVSFDLNVNTGYKDNAGNVGSGFSKSFEMAYVPNAKNSLQLFNDANEFITWGVSEKVGTVTEDPTCKDEGCVKIGAFDNNACGIESSGLALRLLPKTEATHLAIHYRIRYALNDSTYKPNFDTYVPFTVQMAVPGEKPREEAIHPPTPGQVNEGAYNFATAWVTAHIALPASVNAVDEYGVALRVGGIKATQDCGATFKPVENLNTEILIDSIEMTTYVTPQ
jgi:hypothetical protein